MYTHTPRHSDRHMYTDRDTHRHTDAPTYIYRDAHTEIHTQTHTDIYTQRQTQRHTQTHTDTVHRQRHTHRRTQVHTYTHPRMLGVRLSLVCSFPSSVTGFASFSISFASEPFTSDLLFNKFRAIQRIQSHLAHSILHMFNQRTVHSNLREHERVDKSDILTSVI